MAEYVMMRDKAGSCGAFVLEHPHARGLRLQHEVLRCSDSVDWGADNPGCEQLAVALLMDVAADADVAVKLYRRLVVGVLASMPHCGWTITSDQLEDWLIRTIAVMELVAPIDVIELGMEGSDDEA